MKYKAFISYSHRDSAWADWLHKSLESYRPPKHLVGQVTERGPIPKQLSPIFRDREELPSATDLGALLTSALEQSACQIVICSPHSAQSRWVNEEILAFKRLGREDRIFCLIVGGEPWASNDPATSLRECFPAALRFKLDSSGQLSGEQAEPIAADAREGKDGKPNARLKLIAGLLGVGFDALKQREQQRRHRQMAAIASASIAGMVLTSGLAAAALFARANAERQRIRAEAESETARQTAAFLVDLFRVSDPGEARGNTITAREMLDKGASRIDAELANQPAIQATLMDTVGTVYMRLGLYEQARPLLEGALTRRQKLDSADPGLMAGSLNRIGELLALKADYSQAEQRYREAIALRNKGVGAIADTAIIEGLVGLGGVQAKQGRLEEAERSLRSALELERQRYGTSHIEIARTLKDLAIVIYQRGDLAGAIPVLEQALAMQRTLRGELPHPDTMAMLNDLGILLRASGQYPQAERLLSESLAMARTLLGDKHPDVAMALNNLAIVLHDQRNYSRAESTYRQALAMQRELVGNVHPDVANSLSNLAFIQYDRGNPAAAVATLREALDIYRQVFTGDNPEIARVMNTMGYWLIDQRRHVEADDILTQALDMRRRLLGDMHPDVGGTMSHVAMLRVATRRFEEAAELAQAATTMLSSGLSATHWRTAVAQNVNGAALAGLGRFQEAAVLLLRSNDVLEKDPGALPDYRLRSLRYLADLYTQWNKPMEASRYTARIASGTSAQR
jgi:tetratricopeptide (TPR) repeat protein